MHRIFILLVLVIGTALSRNADEKYFYKRFEGTLGGKYSVTMNLLRTDSVIRGNYYYSNQGEPIAFNWNSRIDDDGNIYLEEEGEINSNGESVVTGTFRAKLENGNIKGEWTSSKNRQKLSVMLSEKYGSGSAEAGIQRYYDSYKDSATAEILLLIITEKEGIAAEVINSADSLYSSGFTEDTSFVSPAEFPGKFIKQYIEEVSSAQDYTADYHPIYYYYEFPEVLYNDKYIFSVRRLVSVFTGGAHGNYNYSLSSYNLKSGERLKLTDLILESDVDKLNRAGEKVFRKKFNLEPDKSYEEQGYWGFEEGFKLNDNFAVTAGGLIFQFNTYEITAYAYGAPEIFIPFEELQFLKSDFYP